MSSHIIVVKIGSSVVVKENISATETQLQNVFRTVGNLMLSGYKIIFVLSGAVATGRAEGVLTWKQAQAARGQWLLNAAVERVATREGVRAALLLLSRKEFIHRNRYEAFQKTIATLLDNGYVAVVNENDAVLPGPEDGFPDNDHLAAILAISVHAEQLFLLTNVDGIYSNNPNRGHEVKLLHEIVNVNASLLEIARGEHSATGRGGMVGKLKAARLATATGIPVHVFNGIHPEYLEDIVLREKRHGTFCHPRSKANAKLSDRERWLLSSQNTGSSIQIDPGAVQALRSRKSLLAVGVHALFGQFAEHEVVEIVDMRKETVAVGLTGISSKALEEFIKKAKKPSGVEVIHADNLILLATQNSHGVSL